MDIRFRTYLAEILSHEGGKVDDPKDSGGRTNYGITQNTYNAFNKSKGRAKKDVFNITMDEVVWIYWERYYTASGADKLPDGLAFIHFDTAVNFGVGRAKEFLQQSKNDITKYHELRQNHRKKRIEEKPSQARFKNGWAKRDNSVFAYAVQVSSGELSKANNYAFSLFFNANNKTYMYVPEWS